MNTLEEKITAIYDKYYGHDANTQNLIADLVTLVQDETKSLQQDLDNITSAELGG